MGLSGKKESALSKDAKEELIITLLLFLIIGTLCFLGVRGMDWRARNAVQIMVKESCRK